jgi:menaquinone-dependent protoporphyrinogen oxidase
MNVLVTAASRHGATTAIAEAIGAPLREAGLTVDVLPPQDVADLERYDAVVLGSGVYAGRWVDTARAFVDRHADALATRPVWLFSSGPLGDPPKPAEAPPEGEAIRERIAAREHRVLPGRLDRHDLGFVERTVVAAVRAPDGDFRDWAAIRAWATAIAAQLAEAPVAAR